MPRCRRIRPSIYRRSRRLRRYPSAPASACGAQTRSRCSERTPTASSSARRSSKCSSAAPTRPYSCDRCEPDMRWLDRLLVFCAALVVTVSVLPLGARLFWMLELTTHFRAQYVIVTTVVLALAALRRRWGLVAVLAAAGAISVVPMLPYMPRSLTSEAAAASATAPLKVLTVNVSYRQFQAKRLLESVREANPDVIVVQELT